MYRSLKQRLQFLLDAGVAPLLQTGLVGLEKESLRITTAGTIAHTPHPPTLGASLTHPYITTDYSEALIELITAPQRNKATVIQTLWDTHKFVHKHLATEYLWAASMPGQLLGDESIPIATYGTSNPGIMKTVYRRGLGLRYGRIMQSIAGLHFNYSLPNAYWPLVHKQEQSTLTIQDFTAESYMGMIRNVQRYGWIIPYLFGASPVVCKSFIGQRAHNLQQFSVDTLYRPYATSLRMGDIGYQNSLEEGKGFRANYDSLDSYIKSLIWATETPCPDYEKIGLLAATGEYQQLNTNVLQIENEHYSSIRPKQPLEGLEKPTLALRRRGISYVELRSLDINIFNPIGVDISQLYILEMLLLLCLLNDSPRITSTEAKSININHISTAHEGRKPGLRLYLPGKTISLREWGQELMDGMLPLAQLLDTDIPDSPYYKALSIMQASLNNPDITPSARILAEMETRGENFQEFTQKISQQHQTTIRGQPPLSQEKTAYFEHLAQISHAKQRQLEANNSSTFTEFLTTYFNQGQPI